MTTVTDHFAFAWLGKDPYTLSIYAEKFAGAKAKIMGESPYLDAKQAGISFPLSRKHTVQSVHLYSEGVEGFKAYQSALPAGLTFASSRAEVRAALGEPVKSVEPGGVGIMAIEHSLDRFEAGEYYLSIQYCAGDKTILLVTLGFC
jgi:hypothetical protein